MQVSIKGDTDSEDNVEFLLSDDNFNVPGFVELWEKGQAGAIQLHISDLHAAVNALYDKYIKGLERDRLL